MKRHITDPELMAAIFSDDEDGKRMAAIAQKIFSALKEHQPRDSDGLMDIHAALSLIMALYHCSHCCAEEDNAIINYYDQMLQNFRRDVRFDWEGAPHGIVVLNDLQDLDDDDDPDATRH